MVRGRLQEDVNGRSVLQLQVSRNGNARVAKVLGPRAGWSRLEGELAFKLDGPAGVGASDLLSEVKDFTLVDKSTSGDQLWCRRASTHWRGEGQARIQSE